jgi:hypothetical protein
MINFAAVLVNDSPVFSLIGSFYQVLGALSGFHTRCIDHLVLCLIGTREWISVAMPLSCSSLTFHWVGTGS